MLKKKEFGEAIGRAIDLKIERGIIPSKAEIARHFSVKPPSLVDWVKKDPSRKTSCTSFGATSQMLPVRSIGE